MKKSTKMWLIIGAIVMYKLNVWVINTGAFNLKHSFHLGFITIVIYAADIAITLFGLMHFIPILNDYIDRE